MNIEDFEPKFGLDDLKNFGKLIFQNQSTLMEKYVEIEDKNGLRWTTDIPVNIHSGKGQSQLKDFAWRVMEEVFESLEVAFDMNQTKLSKKELIFHAKEELGDGLHFLIELLILSGIQQSAIEEVIDGFFGVLTDRDFKPESVSFYVEDVHYSTVEFGIWLGRAMNLLKNKPWKQTQYNTDENRFFKYLLEALRKYFILMFQFMTKLEIMNFYFRKTEVNNFRIKSNY